MKFQMISWIKYITKLKIIQAIRKDLLLIL